ncbi:NAD(P)H-dependent oxidoreductase [Pseudoalteromonas denitrificans]|jgi:NAD(P)H-dependent FMN reductase|uniref:NADPH-dependent FMN reductase n=1 Tax=Pseudoalteromonas denitrificans DSM 6059 TaxID=1123010 RepID=A0A1I1EN93_9GAMM|nr:NAD(P)H-dependent oxidoreductase [Pseudoalteromonas denitrificans]SFB88122.1 NADPH-dependent FMN reductase [Pseudoalteromonas denitrificans DSM 6059]
MNLLIVSGSQRKESQSAKVAKYLTNTATLFNEVTHIELCKYNLPFWDGEQASKSAIGSEWPMLNKKIQKADAMVLITPEWGGMATPILKNFLLMCDAQDTAHKPVLLTSVVSGISGAYPIAELKMNALKNNKLVATPEHLIIRHVEEVLNNKQLENLTQRDTNLRDRINYSMHMLHQYSQALVQIRIKHKERPFPKQQEYLYGM